MTSTNMLRANQLVPFPNPVGNTITVEYSFQQTVNHVDFVNYGDIVIPFPSRLYNFGSLHNIGTLNIDFSATPAPPPSVGNPPPLPPGTDPPEPPSPFGLLNRGTLTNDGTLSHTGGNNIALINDGMLINNGSLKNNAQLINNRNIEVRAGSVINGIGTFIQSEYDQDLYPDALFGFERNLIVNGYIELEGTIDIRGGVLSGTGTIASLSAMKIGENASVNPGDSLGTLNIYGHIDLFGTLVVEVLDGLTFDILNVNGRVTFDTTSVIEIVFDPNFIPVDNMELNFLNTGSLANFDLVKFNVTGLPSGFDWSINSNSNQSISLLIQSVSSVPEAPVHFNLIRLSNGKTVVFPLPQD